ncbi:MAG: 50S rRNA methyltransferase [Wigglesworthia glossinidia]|nr:50S rRNA methyltransferase [Wigglesworthia glossinidia]
MHYAHSNTWLSKHVSDQFVKKSKRFGYRSRAWFKLNEIQKINNVISPGMTVLDLGSSPGGWSQYASKQVKKQGHVISCDIQPMHAIPKVSFILGDVFKKNILNNIFKKIKNKIDVILCDIAPNITGITEIDHPKCINMNYKILNLYRSILLKNGIFVIKSFHGSDLITFYTEIKQLFNKIKIFKPNASRAHSKEIYIIAIGYKK